MKKKVGDKVYLQKFDIGYMFCELAVINGALMIDIASHGSFIIDGKEDSLSFVSVGKEAGNWLLNQDWIIDYDEFAKMSPAEVKQLADREADKLVEDCDDFNRRSQKYRNKNYIEREEDKNRRILRIRSLNLMVAHLEGEEPFDVPE